MSHVPPAAKVALTALFAGGTALILAVGGFAATGRLGTLTRWTRLPLPAALAAPPAADIAAHPFWRRPLTEAQVDALVDRCRDPGRLSTWMDVDDAGEVVGEGLGADLRPGTRRYVLVQGGHNWSRAEVLTSFKKSLDLEVAHEGYKRQYARP